MRRNWNVRFYEGGEVVRVGNAVKIVNVMRGKYLPYMGREGRVFWFGNNGYGDSAGVEFNDNGEKVFFPAGKLERVYSAEELAAKEAYEAAEQARMLAEKEAAEKAAAEYKALIERCKFGDSIKVKYEQGGWSDYFEEDIPFAGDVSEEELKKALVSPRQSSSGALRWSNGRNILSIDMINKMVRVCESISLAD